MPEKQVNVDFYGQGQTQGEVAAYAAMNGGKLDPGSMRPWIDRTGKCYVTVYNGFGDPKDVKNYTNKEINVNTGTLRRDEWKRLDDAILEVSRARLGGVQDLVANNLVYNLGNGMGTTVLEYHDSSDSMEAQTTMDGISRTQGDRPVFGYHYLPLPITHVDYEINARVLAASRNMGNALDTTSAEHAARKVLEKIEAMLFTNVTYSFGGGTIYSYINHPDINGVTLTLAWDNASKTGANIVTDVLNMKQASIDAKHYGPWMLYIPTAYETKLDGDYDSTTPGTTTRERIMKIDGIKGIKVIDTMPADNVLLVQMTSDVVRLVQGMPLQNVEWQTEGKFLTKYKVMTIQVPQIRSDQNGASGIVKLA